MQRTKVKMDSGEKDMVRTFVCIELPRSIQSHVEELQKKLRPFGADLSWVRASSIHLTLKFLGDVPHSQMDQVRSAVSRACSDVEPFELTVSGTGGFPSFRNARVLWIGLPRLPHCLRRLHRNIEENLEGAGFARDPRPFSPHLTIARVRSPKNLQLLVDAFSREGFAAESFLARQVVLMKSQLSPGGSVYTPLAVISLIGSETNIPVEMG